MVHGRRDSDQGNRCDDFKYVNIAQARELLVETAFDEWDVVAQFHAVDGRVALKTCKTRAEAENYRERLVTALNATNRAVVPTANANTVF
jgi:hypothetical protein